LVIAVGGLPCKPPIKGIEESRAYAAVDLLCSGTIPDGRNIVMIGGGEVGCETALWLKRAGKEVTIIEMLEELMALEEMKYHTMIMERMLKKEDVRILTSARVDEVKNGFITISKGGDKTEQLKADFIVYAIGFIQPSEKIDKLKNLCENVFIIGDALKPGKIREAVHEGDRIGRLI
jgi:2-enoate reductase